jgi:hypothetical protein
VTKDRGVLMFGGQDSNGLPLNDAWMLELSGGGTSSSWHAIAPLDCARVGYNVIVPAMEISLGFFLAAGLVVFAFLKWRSTHARRGYQPL